MSNHMDLIAEYKKTAAQKTEKELAMLERQIWAAVVPTLEKVNGALASKREWLANALEIPTHAVENRSNLLGYGPVADLLWDRVQDGGMPIRTAIRLAREAKHRARATGVDITTTLERVMSEHDELPMARLPNGKAIHKRSPSMLPRTPPEPKEEQEEETESDPRLFWTSLRAMISGYFHSRLRGLDQGVIETTWRDLETDLKVLLEHFQHKLDRMRRDNTSRSQMVTRGKIIQACHVLNIDPPRAGKPIEDAWRKKEKSHFRRMAALYHPDKSGSEDTREMYEQVVQAHHLLEEI